MDTLHIVAEILGYIALVFGVVSLQFKRHSTVILLRTGTEVIWGVYYLMIGAYTGMAMSVIGCARNLIFTEQVKKGKSTLWGQILFSLIFIISGIFTAKEDGVLLASLAISAKLATTIAYGIKNTRVLRILNFPTYILWIIYDILENSFAGTTNDAIMIVAGVVAFIRLDVIAVRKEREAVATPPEPAAETQE